MGKNLKKKISILIACLALFVMGLGFSFLQKQPSSVKASASILNGFVVDETAAIRMQNPVGLRFTVNLGADAQETYNSLDNVACGSILLPEDMLDGELTLDTPSVLNIPTEKWSEEGVTYKSVLGGSVGDGGMITDLPESFYNRPIAARGYITGTKGGVPYTYYTENTAFRSIGYVAEMATSAGESSDLLTTITNKVEFGVVANDYTMSTTAGEGAILRNAYTTQTDASDVAYFTIGGIKYSGAGISYSVDNTSVAAIENGNLVAKSAGSANLTMTYTYDGNTYSDTCVITVNNDFVGASDYAILLPASATANETKAANTLKNVFAEVGATISIVNETGVETTADKYISIGETTLAKNNASLSVTKDTASQVSAVDNMVFIRGLTDVGTLNGVQQWLGDVLDYDYFLKDTYCVSKKAVAMPTAISYVPEIEYNMIDRNADVMQEYGLQKYSDGVIQVGGNIHNSTLVLHPDTYYNTYADWYATKTTTIMWWESTELIKDGSGKAAELCYTAHGNTTAYNAMVQTAADELVAAFEENPTQDRASFSVRDGYYYCNCDACEAKGNTSDTIVAFLNDVCEKVEEGLAGDARQSTFKIVTLAYHQTNAAPENITSLTNYSAFKNHVELWFGDSYGDYTDGLKNSSSAKNQEIYTNFQNWTNLVGDADVLLWVYYTNTKNGFVPYNTFTAIRENYAMAYEAGVDYIFNQTIQGRSGWTMLKHYLISKLAWNATPTDAEWNAWLDTYFANAYGNGATVMRKWFNDWLDDSLSAYATSDRDPALHRDMVTTSNFPKATMEKWIDYADAALLNLDESDPNYTQHYNNIILEKLSPEYFLIELYGMTSDYAQEFVWGVELWDITHLGESVTIDETLNEIRGTIDSATIEDTFYAELQDDSTYKVTLYNGNIKAGTTYSLTGTTVSSITAGTDGELVVYLPSSVTAGTVKSIVVSSTDYSVTFTNVLAVTKILKTADDLNVLNAYAATEHLRGYYILGNDIDCAGATYSAAGRDGNKTFLGTFDGCGYTISNLNAGANGIFSVLAGMVKNVNFEDASIVKDNNHFTALLAGQSWGNTTIENVNVTFKTIEWPINNTFADWATTGLLVARLSNAATTRISNVTIDATGLDITNALGTEITGVVYENVTIKGDSVSLIACTNANSSTGISEWPTGVTFIDTYEEVTIADQFYVENGNIVLTNAAFEEGQIYDVTVGTTTVQTIITETGKLTATMENMTEGAITVKCVSEGKGFSFTNVLSITKILRTAEDLKVLNAYAASGHITGYYILGNDIDCAGATYASTGRDGNKTFAGTFDGCGYTISNLNAGANGLFNLIVGGTVKNVNFEDASIVKDNYHFTALLAGQSWGNTTIENVNVTFKTIEWPINNVLTDWAATGLLIARLSNASGTTFRNITLDATGLDITNALGTEITNVVYEDVTIKGNSVALIGCTSANSSTGISEWPTGVTFTATTTYTVTAPTTSDYYTFSGATSVVEGRDYTFTVTETVSGLNDFIVLVNGEEVVGNNGTYTVANVTEALTIEVLHGYIEADETYGTTVEYNGNTIKITNSVYASGNGRTHGNAYISAAYLEYMISQGYQYVSFTIQADNAIMAQAVASYNGTIFVYHIDGTAKAFEKELGTTVSNDLQFWGQNASGSGSAIQGKGGYLIISDLVFYKEAYTVTAPTASDYYTFSGATSVVEGRDYTFTVTETVSGLNDFIVLVNGEEVVGNNGTYTVANVTEALTIEVLHGYIEADETYGTTVEYNGDTIKITNSVYASGNGRTHGNAYISAAYLEYMISQGYQYVSFTIQADNAIMAQAVASYNGTIFVYHTDGTAKAFEKELGTTVSNDLQFWGQNASGSGSAIQGKGGYLIISDLVFYKEAYTVTAPAASDYYTFSGASKAIGETDYTFTVTETVSGLNDFIVLVNGEEVVGNNGTYTVANVTEALTIKVVHGYVETGSVSSAQYVGNKLIVTNSTTTSGTAYMAYISEDYVNYMMAQGYTNVHIYLQPDGTKADQAIVACGNTIVRTPSNYTSVANVTLQANTTIKFWCQKNGSGSAIQGQGGYMTITGITYVSTSGTQSGMPETVAVTAPATNSYYTFAGENAVIVGNDYTFTVTATNANCTNFVVFVNDEEVTGNNGTYTVANVTEALTIKVIHGYIEYGTTSSVTYSSSSVATVTNSTSTNSAAFMAYISADYVNYLLSKGYNYWDFYIVPDGTTADTALVMCGTTIARTTANGSTSIARVQLKADTALVFWCQKAGSGSAIQGQGGYMTVTYGDVRQTA